MTTLQNFNHANRVGSHVKTLQDLIPLAQDNHSYTQEGLNQLCAVLQENLQLGSNISERYQAIESTCKAQNALLTTVQAENQLLKRQVVDLTSTNIELKQKLDSNGQETEGEIQKNNRLNDIKLQAQRALLNVANQQVERSEANFNQFKLETNQKMQAMETRLNALIQASNQKCDAMDETTKQQIDKIKHQLTHMETKISENFDKNFNSIYLLALAQWNMADELFRQYSHDGHLLNRMNHVMNLCRDVNSNMLLSEYLLKPENIIQHLDIFIRHRHPEIDVRTIAYLKDQRDNYIQKFALEKLKETK